MIGKHKERRAGQEEGRAKQTEKRQTWDVAAQRTPRFYQPRAGLTTPSSSALDPAPALSRRPEPGFKGRAEAICES